MSGLESRRVGFVGGGAMAEALCGGLLAAGVPASQLRVADPDPERRRLLAERLRVEVSADNAFALEQSDVVVIAVKPGIVSSAVGALRDVAGARQPLWISIAAGVRLASLAAALPDGARIVRAMPNTPALVRCGATAICGNERAGADDLALARALFESVGICWETRDESLLDAVTGLSGSGPAYVMLMIEAMADGGVKVGLHRDTALLLAAQTVYGSAKLLLETGEHPGRLKDMVTSPGGTAIAGLHTLESGGLRRTLIDAVEAATNRAIQLGEQMAAKMAKK